jgi:hypothetical protein
MNPFFGKVLVCGCVCLIIGVAVSSNVSAGLIKESQKKRFIASAGGPLKSCLKSCLQGHFDDSGIIDHDFPIIRLYIYSILAIINFILFIMFFIPALIPFYLTIFFYMLTFLNVSYVCYFITMFFWSYAMIFYENHHEYLDKIFDIINSWNARLLASE